MGVELAPVEAMLDEIHDSLPSDRDHNAYTMGKLADTTVVAVMPEIGNSAAADCGDASSQRLPFDFIWPPSGYWGRCAGRWE